MDHVTEVKSNINDKTISFLMMLEGKPVNTGRVRIKDLHGSGLVYVNVHDAIDCLRSKPGLEISVLINGKPEMILRPIYLIMCVRIIFNCCCSAGGIQTLSVKGLDVLKKDGFLRIRFLKDKRGKEYERRENNPELGRIIWPLEEEETYVKSDNETCKAIAAPANVCFIEPNEPIPELNDDLGNNEEQICSAISPSCQSGSSYDLPENIDDGLPSPSRITNNTTALSLTYKTTSVVGEVAVTPYSGINGNIVHQMSNALIGFLGDKETPNFTSRRESLTERLREFGECRVGLLTHGFFSLFFSSDEYKTKVLEHGQLFIDSRPLILKKWTEHLILEPAQFLHSLPVWIRLHKLNWAHWSSESLSCASSMIGIPLSMDYFTASIISDPQFIYKCASTSKQCPVFARVCVEIDPSKALPDVVPLPINGKVVQIRVEYEWKPQLCMHCSSLYHDSTSCNLNREDLYLQRQDKHVIIEELEAPKQDNHLIVEELKAHEQDNHLIVEELKAPEHDKHVIVEELEQDKQVIVEELEAHEQDKNVIVEELEAHEQDKNVIVEELEAYAQDKHVIVEELEAPEQDKDVIVEELEAYEQDKNVINKELGAHEQDKHVIVEELEAPKRVLRNLLPSPHSLNDEITGLITDDDGRIGESGPKYTMLSIPQSPDIAFQGVVEKLVDTPKVELTRFVKFFKFISRVLPSRSQHLTNKSIS